MNDELKNLALDLYKPPFRHVHGYIQDANGLTVADDAAGNAALRIRGWGRIQYMKDAEELQDGVAELIADALTEYWRQMSAPAAEQEEESAKDGWRRLALQFDGHRMQALHHLRAMLQDAQVHAPLAEEFLKAPPLDGEAVLAQRIAASQQAAEPKRQVFIDEIDAAKAGSAWMEPFFAPGFRLCYSQDEGAQAPQVKWCMLFDSLDRVIAGYMLTRDAKNWTELTLVGRPAPATQQPQDERAGRPEDHIVQGRPISDWLWARYTLCNYQPGRISLHNPAPHGGNFCYIEGEIADQLGAKYDRWNYDVHQHRAALAKKGGAA